MSVIALMALVVSGDLEEGIAAECPDFRSKSIDFADLLPKTEGLTPRRS